MVVAVADQDRGSKWAVGASFGADGRIILVVNCVRGIGRQVKTSASNSSVKDDKLLSRSGGEWQDDRVVVRDKVDG
jgi:hypothetical protein